MGREFAVLKHHLGLHSWTVVVNAEHEKYFRCRICGKEDDRAAEILIMGSTNNPST